MFSRLEYERTQEGEKSLWQTLLDKNVIEEITGYRYDDDDNVKSYKKLTVDIPKYDKEEFDKIMDYIVERGRRSKPGYYRSKEELERVKAEKIAEGWTYMGEEDGLPLYRKDMDRGVAKTKFLPMFYPNCKDEVEYRMHPFDSDWIAEIVSKSLPDRRIVYTSINTYYAFEQYVYLNGEVVEDRTMDLPHNK